jgi:uncharacterized membrane protein YfcA
VIEVIGFVLLGLFAGSVAAALGVGGGIIFVPALAIVAGFDQHLAQGTSLAIILPTAIVATTVHARGGRVVWRIAIPVGLTGIVGAIVGARVAIALDPELLSRLFGVLLIGIAIRMLFRARKPTPGRVTGRSEPGSDPS